MLQRGLKAGQRIPQSDGHVGQQVVAAPVKPWVGLLPDADFQVTGLPVNVGLAFAVEYPLLAIHHAWLNVNIQLQCHSLQPDVGAVVTHLNLVHLEAAGAHLLRAHFIAAVALACTCSLLCHCLGPQNLEKMAVVQLFKGGIDFQIDVMAAQRLLLAAAAKRVEKTPTKHAGKDIAGVGVHALLQALFAVPVVGLAFVLVAQHLIRSSNVLKAVGGSGIASVLVRVILHGQLAVCLFDFLLCGTSWHAQDVVKISPCQAAVKHHQQHYAKVHHPHGSCGRRAKGSFLALVQQRKPQKATSAG
eukprot:m.25949 g.25949  ORF g.25949 m.25949 type:complete len:302 (-) comp11448_c0_seq1:10-915(-)